jgi:hypothetical protein
MQDRVKLKLDYLASTYGIDRLGLAWIQDNPDGTRSLILCRVPESGITMIVPPGGTMRVKS